MARRVEEVEPYWVREVEQSNPKVSSWQAPPGLLERIEADQAAYRRGEARGMAWEELEPILDAWIAECGPLDDEDADEAP